MEETLAVRGLPCLKEVSIGRATLTLLEGLMLQKKCGSDN